MACYYTNGNYENIFEEIFLKNSRRNDRRIRYFAETFNSLMSKQSSKPITFRSSDNSEQPQLNLRDDLFVTKYQNKLLSKYKNKKFQKTDHIYSQDPLESKHSLGTTNDDNSLVYECID